MYQVSRDTWNLTSDTSYNGGHGTARRSLGWSGKTLCLRIVSARVYKAEISRGVR